MKQFRIPGLAVVATTLLSLLFAGEADALGGHFGRLHASWGGSHGSGGSYGGSYGSWGSHGRGGFYGNRYSSRRSHGCGGSYGGRYGSWGSHGSGGSYGGRYGSWGSHGSGGSYGSRHGSWTYRSRGSYSGDRRAIHYYTSYSKPGVAHRTRVVSPVSGGSTSAKQSAARGVVKVASKPTSRSTSNHATVAVAVPDNAIVYVNGNRTESTGEHRTYLSRQLKANQSARFAIRTVVESGKGMDETKVVTVKSGHTAKLSFGETAEPVRTALILHVPTDAKVQIEGIETATTGPRRVMTTKRLAVGEESQGLSVRVSLNKSGRVVVKEQNVSLQGGEQRELIFDFDDTALVSR